MGIVQPRHTYWDNEKTCKKCHVFLRRLYVREIYYEDAEGKRHERIDTYNLTKKRAFTGVAWWCPSCNNIKFDGQASKESKDISQESGKIQCRECGSTTVIKQKERGESTQYRCGDCLVYFSVKKGGSE